ncbi:hypothetical protein [Pseudanabaena yagii]|uniref:Uncharacterized protein n=1 Tax=Pseudanabaena yagii GIHE-NHR1 TaxID=2722753 RepID=A0ABX1LUX6_9CYAN|nr:hypothetical protein [Pseudanabaena yagii]NMF59068.1 hypothetical protein [Pseudanabaena yagii GIHE-NHR1]
MVEFDSFLVLGLWLLRFLVVLGLGRSRLGSTGLEMFLGFDCGAGGRR